MLHIILKVVPAFISWGIFIYVLFYIPYPESLTQADIFQLLSFFIPFFLALVFTLNILVRSILISIIISFGAIILLVLKALDSLNLVSGTLTILAVLLLFSYFNPSTHFIRSGSNDLTSGSFIPKLKHLRRKDR